MPTQTLTEARLAQLDELLVAGVERGDVAGVTAVVVDRDAMRWIGGFGERSFGSGVAMTPDTVGAIFSMTKAITGAAAMQCVERGLLDLDAPAGEILADLANPVVLTGFDADGHPETRAAKTDITLRNLLTHTSGYVYDIWSPELAAWYEATGTPNIFSLALDSLRVPLMFDPGDRWEYGIGIDWAGLMVQEVTGQTLGEFLTENLFEPLAMPDTAFAPSEEMLSRFAGMHARTPTGGLAPIEIPAADNPEFEMGGGGLASTMADFGRFMRMILNDGDLDGARVLQAGTVEDMCTNQMGDLRVSELITAMPEYSNNAEMFPGEAKSWGLTFQIHEQPGSIGCPTGTLSWAGLANSYFFIDRKNGVAGAYMTQILPFADAAAIDLFYDFQQAIYTAL